MQSKILCASLVMLLWGSASAQHRYEVSTDLRVVKNDRLQVDIRTPSVREKEIEFHMPKIVPGTYSISNFGRFLRNVQAFDKENNNLPIERLDTNRWKIKKATQLSRISYWVDDTFDEKESDIFQPAGSNIEEGESFVINTFCFFGYLDGYKELPYILQIHRQKTFYGTTALQLVERTEYTDTYEASNYFELADGPLLYARPDTASVLVGGAKVEVGVYATKGGISANLIRDEVTKVLHAQTAYLGGKLPVDRYAFLVYAEEVLPGSSYGALEHAYSSLYYLPEPRSKAEANRQASTIRSIAAHEFFHIITPLTIHSEEIGNFDFISPKMSKHLWMYEGVTEYFSHHAQLTADITDGEEFVEEISKKIHSMQNVFKDDLPFTEMSKEVLNIYEDQYPNVYEKGAVIGLCLDILLREYSKGQKGLMDLMKMLSKEYGKDKSFKDEELFDKITELTDPRIRLFFKKCVEGRELLPLSDLLPKIGISYDQSLEKSTLMAGNAPIDVEYLRFVDVPAPLEENPEEQIGKALLVTTTGKTEGPFTARYSLLRSLGDIEVKDYTSSEEVLSVVEKTFKIGDQVPYTAVLFSPKDGGLKLKKGTLTFSKGKVVSNVKIKWIEEKELSSKQKSARADWLSYVNK